MWYLKQRRGLMYEDPRAPNIKQLRRQGTNTRSGEFWDRKKNKDGEVP